MFDTARKIAHKHTPRCKGNKRREHSDACVSLTKEIERALGAAYDQGNGHAEMLTSIRAAQNSPQPMRKCSTCETEHLGHDAKASAES